ncbi:hypothetical protein JQN58_35340 [Aneurinibacillus sp. BA2021]|nr:hypothetical protein [Aneurinibacillus sp. BA2021]
MPRPPVNGTAPIHTAVLATAPHHRNGEPARLMPCAITFQAAWATAAPRTRTKASGDTTDPSVRRRHDEQGPPGFCPVR